MKTFIASIILVFLITSCNSKITSFEVENIIALTNLTSKDNIKHLDIDYNEAFEKGFVIPSKNQTTDGYFEFKFDIKNNTKQAKKFFYKI